MPPFHGSIRIERGRNGRNAGCARLSHYLIVVLVYFAQGRLMLMAFGGRHGRVEAAIDAIDAAICVMAAGQRAECCGHFRRRRSSTQRVRRSIRRMLFRVEYERPDRVVVLRRAIRRRDVCYGRRWTRGRLVRRRMQSMIWVVSVAAHRKKRFAALVVH